MTFTQREVGNPLKGVRILQTDSSGEKGEEKGSQLGGSCSIQASSTDDLDQRGISGSY